VQVQYSTEEGRIAEVWSNSANGSFGSGYLLGGGLVLTARHVILPDGGAPPTVIKSRPLAIANKVTGLELADLVWPNMKQLADSDAPDGVLLRLRTIPNASDPGPQLGPPPADRRGRGTSVNATGFPAFAKSDSGRRDTEQISGVVFSGTTLVARRYQISDMTVRDRQKLNEGLDWHGISGSALLANGRVVGILIARKTPDQRYDFSAIRIEALLADSMFMSAIRGNAVLVEGKSGLLPVPYRDDKGISPSPNNLVEYLYCDLPRIDSYASQISKSSKSLSVHEKITLLNDFLKKNNLVTSERPAKSRIDEAALIHETIEATRVIFPRLPGMVDLLPDISVWVAPPTEPPNLNKKDDSEPRGTFLYLIEAHTQPYLDETHARSYSRHISGLSALEMILRDLARDKLISPEIAEKHSSRDNCSLPLTVLRQAGGLVQKPRRISVLYRPRYLSDDQYVQVSGQIVRCYDLYAYPIFIALCS
jgi:hypothetical protein